MSKLFYVYRITNIVERKHYYGYRSTKNQPKDDLGKIYFSSSTDKNFKLDQNNNPQNYRYKIIYIFDNKEDALKLEIKLHNKFKVASNEHFYNKANQTSNRFTTTGVSSPAKNIKKFMLREIKTGKVIQIKGNTYDKTKYVGHTKGKTKVKQLDGTIKLVPVETLNEKIRGLNSGKVVALNVLTNKKELISKELFDSSDVYVGHSKGYKPTEETRAKLREKNKNNKGGAGNKGKPKSPEHIANVIAAKKRNKLIRLQALELFQSEDFFGKHNS